MYNLDIYLMKCFSRMRNKAQIFSAQADDHYHTRLLHSLEVNSIALKISKKIKEQNLNIKINDERLSKIALLHDIGHTPFGHVGEKTLNDLCSGEIKIRGVKDYKFLKCGFKHNINSGILYKEYLIKNNKKITREDVHVIDGIIKHTSLFYKNNKKLDNGFGYLFEGIKFKHTYNSQPLTFEGIIVAFADEIAQICSDTVDLYSNKTKIENILKADVFENIHEKDIRKLVSNVVDNLINQFVDDVKKGLKTYNQLNNGNIGCLIKNFDEIRKEIIRNHPDISNFDKKSRTKIIKLFTYYFLNPTEAIDLLEDFYHRIKRMQFTKTVLDEINKYDKKIHIYIKIVINNLDNCDLKKSKLKDYKSIYKMYIRSVAIYVSKMTDTYATEKFNKIKIKLIIKQFFNFFSKYHFSINKT